MRGTRIVYTSCTLSLAALELLANADHDVLPDDLVSIEFEIPEDVKVEESLEIDLPSDWSVTPAPPHLQALGTKWTEQNQTAVLRVPSAVIPEEHNYLINPAHPQSASIVAAAPKAFAFDPRLLS